MLGLACVLVLVGAAQAVSRKARNWPNNPPRHALHQRFRSRDPSFAANLRGGVSFAANALETCPTNSRRPRRRPRAEQCLGHNNNGENMIYVNVDPGGGRFDSSTATLTLPAGAEVQRAYLYWAADLSRGILRPPNDASDDAPGGDSPATNSLYTTALLRAGSNPYATIDATAAGRNGRWDFIKSWYDAPGQLPGWAYQVRADVTDEVDAAVEDVPAGGPKSVPITVANVQAGKGYNRYAGWNLVVVWASATAPWRDITLFDGFDFVQVSGEQELVVGPLDFTGFQTPQSGEEDAHVTVWATEGDRGNTGDYLSLGPLSNTCADLTAQSDAKHDADNFFNSTISSNGAAVGGRTPGYDNQLGFDFSTLAVPEDTIPKGATGASVCLGTIGDTYFFGGVVFDTLIRAPNLAVAKAVDPASAVAGGVATYTTTVTNPSLRDPSDPLSGQPVDAATNLVVADELPSGLGFVRFSANPGSACTYTPASRTVSCSLARLAPDATLSYAYEARVEAAPQGSAGLLENEVCLKSNSEDQPATIFRGCDDAELVVPPGPPPSADLGVVKTVSRTLAQPGATLTWQVVGTNYGPAASSGFVLADELPRGVEFVRAGAPVPLSCTTPAVGAGGAVVCTAGAAVPAAPAQGSSLTLTITATIPSSAATGSLLTNVATVSDGQTEPLPDLHPNRAETATLVAVAGKPTPPPTERPLPEPPGRPPDPPVAPQFPPKIPVGLVGTIVSIRKSGSPKRAPLGGSVKYSLRVANVGDADAVHVRVCDAPSSGLAVTAAPGFNRTRSGVCTTISKLPTAATERFQITATVTSAKRGRVVNRATIRFANGPSRQVFAVTRISGRRVPRVTG